MSKRVLFVGESSLVASGYGVIQKNIGERFHKAGFEIAELSAGIAQGDPRLQLSPWKIYPVVPHPENHKGKEVFNSHPLNKLGKYIFEEVCLDFQPHCVCVPPGELVMTEDGYRPIEYIKIGDRVLTHKNRFRPVLKTMNRYHKDKIVSIYVNGCTEPLKLTPEHPVLTYKKRRLTNQLHTIEQLYGGIEPEWIPSKDVQEGDLVVLAKIENNNQIDRIDAYDYVSNCRRDDDKIYPLINRETVGINRHINLNSDFCRLLGYFIGDGCAQERTLRFFFGINEENYVKDIINLLRVIFDVEATYKKCPNQNMLIVESNNTILCQFIQSLCGKPKKKYIPKFFWQNPNKENIEAFLCGLYRADGTYSNNTVSLTTHYKRLAYEVRMLCISVDIPVSLSKVNRDKESHQDKYKINGYGSSAKSLHSIVKKDDDLFGLVDDYPGIKRARLTRILNNHLVASVKRKRFYDYEGKVYNLEVEEDNSYNLQFCVHNCCWTDPFMAPLFISESPYRKYFKFLCQAPVDGYPQYTDWLYLYKDVDALFTYTDWGTNILKLQMNNPANLKGSAYLCADFNIFKPLPKAAVRDHLEIEDDVNIIGMVARNQPRKAFEELFASFAKYLNEVPYHLSKKTYLYLHTSYFDDTWDLEYLLNKYALYSKVLFTYKCVKCGDFKPLFMCGPRKVCEKCGAPKEMTSTHNGVSPEQLNLIYNVMDVYCQLHYLEGFGIPCLEATAAGLPLMVSDFASTKDFITNLDAIPIKVIATKVETKTHREWGIPDVNHLSETMKKLMLLPKTELSAMGMISRDKALNLYKWDFTANKFMEWINTLSNQSMWGSPPNIQQSQPMPPPNQLRNVAELVESAIINVARRPELLKGFKQSQWEKRLTNRVDVMETMNGPMTKMWTPDDLINEMVAMRNYFNHWENIRGNFIREGRIK